MLMLSEGGNGLYHALSGHHSDSLWGPYITDMINPVLSHRQLGSDYSIQAIGHGDLVETQNGEWWCLSLGKSVIDKETTLANETFLSKVEFDIENLFLIEVKEKCLKNNKDQTYFGFH